MQDIVGISRDEFATWVELGGKVLLGIGAICYAVGFVVVNAYLLKYGVYSASLFRTEYVLAGILWLFLLAVASVLVASADKSLKRARLHFAEGRRLLPAIVVALRILLALGTPMVLVGLFSGQDLVPWDWRTWIVVAVILLTPGYIVPHAREFGAELRAWRATGGAFADFPIYGVSMICLFGFLAIGSYAHIAYPSFLPMYGGGRPTVVRLVPVPGSAEVFSAIAVGPATAGGEDFDLIAETSDWLVLARSQPIAMFAAPRSPFRLRRDMVAAIQVRGVQETTPVSPGIHKAG